MSAKLIPNDCSSSDTRITCLGFVVKNKSNQIIRPISAISSKLLSDYNLKSCRIRTAFNTKWVTRVFTIAYVCFQQLTMWMQSILGRRMDGEIYVYISLQSKHKFNKIHPSSSFCLINQLFVLRTNASFESLYCNYLGTRQPKELSTK